MTGEAIIIAMIERREPILTNRVKVKQNLRWSFDFHAHGGPGTIYLKIGADFTNPRFLSIIDHATQACKQLACTSTNAAAIASSNFQPEELQ